MKIPSFLKAGDTIGICAPARKVSKDDIRTGIWFLESKGFIIKESTNLYKADHQFGGVDSERITDFQELLNDTEVKAIMAVRGGYGCVRIIDHIDFSILEKSPKWIIGFSDMTVIHSHLHQNLNLATIHAPMLFNFSNEKRNDEAAEHFINVISGMHVRYEYKTEASIAHLNKSGSATAKLTGGNLSVLYSIAGSVSDIDTNGKILFLEDLDEYLYHIDRMMMQLKRNGKLEHLAGLIVGGMNDMKDNTIPFGKSAEEIITDVVKEYDYPVAFGFPAGHIANNFAMVFGEKVSLNVDGGAITFNSNRI